MNKNKNQIESYLLNEKTDWAWDLLKESFEYTSDWDMLVWELEKKRIAINNIF